VDSYELFYLSSFAFRCQNPALLPKAEQQRKGEPSDRRAGLPSEEVEAEESGKPRKAKVPSGEHQRKGEALSVEQQQQLRPLGEQQRASSEQLPPFPVDGGQLMEFMWNNEMGAELLRRYFDSFDGQNRRRAASVSPDEPDAKRKKV
jgi:hypothetical protein